jgi:uncharacterized membrane protein YfcA
MSLAIGVQRRCLVENRILLFAVVGFIAQMIDGTLGMAYGVSSTAFLLGLGVSPAVASANVHTAEVFTTLVSGLSHLKLGNVDKRLFRKLVIPGVLGGVLGAYVLTSVPGQVIRPFVSIYLLAMGVVIIYKVLSRKRSERSVETHLIPLAIMGGFFDAIGGGGWGPIVTSTIVARGHDPRTTIGSVNLAEFFVTFAEVVTFVLMFGFVDYKIIVGLIAGGILAAPVSAFACKRIPSRALMTIVGTLIIALSLRTIYLALI